MSEADSMDEATWLVGYLADPHTRLPLQQPDSGTAYQQRVWRALQQIPVGEVRTYGELASELGSCARAVEDSCFSYTAR